MDRGVGEPSNRLAAFFPFDANPFVGLAGVRAPPSRAPVKPIDMQNQITIEVVYKKFHHTHTHVFEKELPAQLLIDLQALWNKYNLKDEYLGTFNSLATAPPDPKIVECYNRRIANKEI